MRAKTSKPAVVRAVVKRSSVSPTLNLLATVFKPLLLTCFLLLKARDGLEAWYHSGLVLARLEIRRPTAMPSSPPS
jgi:hypothetical protein